MNQWKWSLALVVLQSTVSLADSSANIVEKLSSAAVSSPTDLQSYEGGIRIQNKFDVSVDPSIRFESTFYEGLSHDYGKLQLARTMESSVYSKISWLDSFNNEWFAGYNYSKAIQDIERANYSDDLHNYKQTNYSFYYGWKRTFFNKTFFTMYSGFTTCLYNLNHEQIVVPIGGLAFSHLFKDGSITFEFSHKVEGSGETSGIYGSQTLKEARVSGAWSLGKNLVLSSSCFVSKVIGNFLQESSPNKSPILIASAGLEYKINKNLSTKANFIQRSYLGNSFGNALPEGPSGSFAVNYVAF